MVTGELGPRIVRGDFLPGEQLPNELVFGKTAGVSRSVVREAMRVLASKGLVQARPKTGTRVLPREQWDLMDQDVLEWCVESGNIGSLTRDLIEARYAIEPIAAGKAAERRTSDDLTGIDEAFSQMVKYVDETPRFVEADLRFHDGILSASKNELFVRMGRAIRAALTVSRQITTRKAGSSAASLALHSDVLEAIGRQDAAGAQSSMFSLISLTAADIDAVLGAEGAGKLEVKK
ncbi:MAG TPA: FadR/GntR family transcriptional regulator [Tepidisphaeraceae bacterium]|nr:FadR/GntR family transcriptional regulator [Tepidisphaeraceae bacterium]